MGQIVAKQWCFSSQDNYPCAKQILCYKNPQRNAHRLRSRAGSLYCHNSSSLRHKYALSRYKYASMSPVRAPKSLLPRCIIRDLQIRERERLRGGDLIDLEVFFPCISLDCEQSLFFFRFSEGSARARERASPISRLQSRAWSFSCLVRFSRRTKNS